MLSIKNIFLNYKKSSSFHKFNSDRNNLNFFQKIYWLVLNFINNFLPNANYKPFKIVGFKNFKFQNYKDKNLNVTPSRFLSNMFWENFNWTLLKEALKDINILDTGCGSGQFALELFSYYENINSYTGIDFQKFAKWKNISENNNSINFIQNSSTNLKNSIPINTNLFISQSAIEHFEDDLLYFRQIKQFITKTNSEVFQIHLFPSEACLWTYLCHGVRQYSPRSISKIVEIFLDNSYAVLYPLGGKNLNNFHFREITIPLMITKKYKNYTFMNQDKYKVSMIESLKKDLKIKSKTKATFYALLIHSNYKDILF